ncbi:uncharacterized protein K452DRAFT_288601 [Aplosporella prunicola CBS 121167]|uniref:Uncharacterized protein n=1 Tax=Aplosporella prunicola CBS 121167 TaxID=1176127 RepID=A0A6A6BDI1_9PEZI|nr:uncharacterized protein K452DRAFT_288601 [Aplosporella prunicola CBS 121167]KAF2140521.1 hypothetical protein K452DRAFT_288601 [Aplosporella prunicola CBS 121167]
MHYRPLSASTPRSPTPTPTPSHTPNPLPNPHKHAHHPHTTNTPTANRPPDTALGSMITKPPHRVHAASRQLRPRALISSASALVHVQSCHPVRHSPVVALGPACKPTCIIPIPPVPVPGIRHRPPIRGPARHAPLPPIQHHRAATDEAASAGVGAVGA